MDCICTSLLKLNTNCSWAAFIARLTVAGVILPHGLQKTLGWFGGYGFSGTMQAFTTTMGLPTVIAFLVIAAESAGALSLAFGFLTRFCAASLAIVMAGAAWIAHANNGFFMNWFGQQAGEGFEYHLLVIGLCVSLVVSGGGALSLDRYLCKGSACGNEKTACCG